MLLDMSMIVVGTMNGVFNSPSLLLLFKIFSVGFSRVFCCCNTACLKVSSNGLAIIIVVRTAVDDEPNKFEVVCCPVDADVVTIVAVVVTGMVVEAVLSGGPVNEDIITMFCRSWKRPMSSQCLINVFGVGNCCCCWLCSVVAEVVIDVVTDGSKDVRRGRANCRCSGNGDKSNKGGGVDCATVVAGTSESGGAVNSKIHIYIYIVHI